MAPLLERIKQWGGQTEFDGQGRLVGVDLLRASLADADVDQLAKLPHLQRLQLKGAEITDASMPQLARLTELTDLALDTVAVTDAGVRTLMALQEPPLAASAPVDADDR